MNQIEEDRVEMNDLAEQYPEKVRELAEQYERCSKSAGVIPWDDYMKVTKTGYLLKTQEIGEGKSFLL